MWGTVPSDYFDGFVTKYFNDSQLKYTVKYTQKNAATFDSDLIEALASGSGPDAIVLPEDLIVRYSNKIFTIPYAVLPELTFKQTFVNEGQLYLNSTGALALPFIIDPLVMYWNKDIFNNAGVTNPPNTWVGISSLASQMSKKDKIANILSSAVALGEFRNIVNAKEILASLIMQAGNPIVNFGTDGYFKSTLKDDFGLKTAPTVLALQFYTNFSNPSRPEYSWNRSLTNSLDAFASGDLAIYFGFASEFAQIKDKNPNLNFDVSMLPQGTGTKTINSTFGNMIGFAILKNSTNPSGAYTVLSSLASANAVPYWTNIFNLPSARQDSVHDVNNSAIKTIFNRSAVISRGWYDPNSLQTSAIFQNMVESFTTSRGGADEVVGTASDQIDSLIK